MLHARRISCLTLAGAALSCRAQPVTAPRTDDPVALVSPDTGPSPMQLRLAALTPTPTANGDKQLDAAVDAFHARTKGRRGYIAVDKPIYQPGETIWFRAFDLASADLQGGDKGIVTVKLVSPRGAAAAEKHVLLSAGSAPNDFVLPAGMPGGEYVISAETDHGTKYERRVIVSSYEAPRIKKKLEFVRKAYGPGDMVMATVALNRATGEALAKKAAVGLVTLDGADLARVPITTDAEGNTIVKFELPKSIQRGDGLLTILVDDGGVTESIQKRIPITLADLRFTAYPEGGDLIAGLPARVYFAAKNPLDKPADIEGRVVDDRGQVVALLRSYHDGMGRFDLYPEPGHKYEVEITKPSGIAKKFALPEAHEHGCTMQALDDFASTRTDVRVAVWCTSSQDVVLAAVMREKRVATATASVRGGAPSVVVLPVPTGAQGAVRVTVFDRKLAPLAERLVYRNRGKDLKITITADRETYNPRDQVKLAIETKSPEGKPIATDLAMSVVDDTVLAFADDKQATILARLYLEAEMPNQKIEEPNFYFGTDPKAPASIDLVLGTQGWRRFDWKPVFAAPPKPPITDPWTFDGEYWKDELRNKPQVVRKPGATPPVAAVPPMEEERDEGKKLDKEKAADEKPVVAARVAPAAPIAPAPVVMKPPAPPEPKFAAGRMRVAEDRVIEPAPAPPPAQIHVMGRAPMVDQGDMGGEVRGEAIMLDDAPAVRHRVLRNRGNFDLGEEQDKRGHHIRDARRRQENIEQDPYCCLEPTREFPVPNYAGRYDGPRSDFRETLLWRSSVQTDAAGKAQVSFFLSDAVTSFKVTAEGMAGGALGRGESQVQSKKPVSLAVKLPLEVSAGDQIRLPVTITNETNEPYNATLSATFGKAFAVKTSVAAPTVKLAAKESRSLFYELAVVGDGKVAADGKVAISVDAANLRDEVQRTILVAPVGFPQEVSLAGTLEKTARHEIVISDVMPGTMRGTLSLYPSPLATMVKGSEAMIAEPGGCFEQASSTNYPNIMILGYLEETGGAEPAIVERAHTVLDKGYKLLTGYETKSRGYEWFGGEPGHEALTAYGLMEFRDMSKVYSSVDKSMVDRTRQWLRGRRDGKGGFQTNARALDSFGRASADVTDAYITYALSEAGEKDLDAELGKQRAASKETKDPYLMALATKSLVNASPKDDATRAAAKRLAGMQDTDGSFPHADHSITRSGGEALTIETTALAALALMAAGGYTPEVRRAVEWMNSKRSGGSFGGSTQSTVLALKAMAAFAKDSRRTDASGVITLSINGKQVARVPYEKGHQGAIELPLAENLRSGKNVIELTLDSTSPLPYSGVVSWGSKVPATSAAAKVRISTLLAKSTVKLGEGAHMDVKVTNTSSGGIPMTLARVGMPGGLTFQTWQLKELRDKGLIDFYETREREVILYFRALAPNAVKDVPLELMATVPGTFTAPASRAYLYYTAEHKFWVEPTTVTVVP